MVKIDESCGGLGHDNNESLGRKTSQEWSELMSRGRGRGVKHDNSESLDRETSQELAKINEP